MIDVDEVRRLRGEGRSQQEIADRLGVHRSTVSRALSREPAGQTVEVAESFASFDGVQAIELGDAEKMIRSRGLDPDDWVVTGSSLTTWGENPSTGEPYERLKVNLKRRASLDVLRPAVHVPPVERLGRHPALADGEPWLGVIVADDHAPHHEPALHEALLGFLADVLPERGFHAGDLLDLPSPSRHRRNPAWHATPQDCVDAGYRLLRERVEASPGTRWEFTPGNHDVRIRNFLLDADPDLATLRPADRGEPEPEALALRRLLHLDALGIRCVEPDGEYADGSLEVCENLELVHGERTSKTAADVELERYGHSIGFGHTHRKRTVFRTTYKHGRPVTHVGVEIGCMARVEGGLGYARRPDWQQGFATVSVWPDGRFNVEHAVWAGGSLFWRDRRWTP